MAADYAKVSIHAGSLGTLTAKPIIYGLTIPTNAPDAALGQKFIHFVHRPAGPGDHAQQRVRGHLSCPGQPPEQGSCIDQAAHHAVAIFRRVSRGRLPGGTMTR